MTGEWKDDIIHGVGRLTDLVTGISYTGPWHESNMVERPLAARISFYGDVRDYALSWLFHPYQSILKLENSYQPYL